MLRRLNLHIKIIVANWLLMGELHDPHDWKRIDRLSDIIKRAEDELNA